MNTSSPHLIPVTEWANYHSYPPIGQLRALIFNADKNGFMQWVKCLYPCLLTSLWLINLRIKHANAALAQLVEHVMRAHGFGEQN